jgi:hypothetical protein
MAVDCTSIILKRMFSLLLLLLLFFHYCTLKAFTVKDGGTILCNENQMYVHCLSLARLKHLHYAHSMKEGEKSVISVYKAMTEK